MIECQKKNMKTNETNESKRNGMRMEERKWKGKGERRKILRTVEQKVTKKRVGKKMKKKVEIEHNTYEGGT